MALVTLRAVGVFKTQAATDSDLRAEAAAAVVTRFAGYTNVASVAGPRASPIEAGSAHVENRPAGFLVLAVRIPFARCKAAGRWAAKAGICPFTLWADKLLEVADE